MARSISPFLLTFCMTSCGDSITTGSTRDTPAVRFDSVLALDQSSSNAIDFDPFFVEASEPVSPRGPRALTRNILQAQNGDLWFATWQGLVRFDGKLFTNHTSKGDLRRHRVFSLLEAENGNLWIGTIGGGAYRYDGRTFFNFTETDGLGSDDVLSLYEDASGNIWFGSDEGVSSYDGKRFTRYTTEDGLSDDAVNAIVQDSSGALWLGTQRGLDRFDGGTITEFLDADGESFDNVRSIITDRGGNLWIGSEDGLTRYDGKSLARVSDLFIGRIFEDPAGTIWVSGSVSGENLGRVMGLYRYEDSALTLITTSKAVFGIESDSEGNIWFGTLQGACKYDGKAVTTCTE